MFIAIHSFIYELFSKPKEIGMNGNLLQKTGKKTSHLKLFYPE